MTKIQTTQQLIGAIVDNIWGPKSQLALIRSSDAVKKKVQTLLGTTSDGIWGPISQAALLSEVNGGPGNVFSCMASSFADPADLVGFNRCKSTGKSDVRCFAVGDNGIGQFGKITAQEDIPMVAVNSASMIARWGSIHGAAHRPVRVTANGKTIDATVEDRISAPGRIDLNPACAKLLGLRPPFLVQSTWYWV